MLVFGGSKHSPVVPVLVGEGGGGSIAIEAFCAKVNSTFTLLHFHTISLFLKLPLKKPKVTKTGKKLPKDEKTGKNMPKDEKTGKKLPKVVKS